MPRPPEAASTAQAARAPRERPRRGSDERSMDFASSAGLARSQMRRSGWEIAVGRAGDQVSGPAQIIGVEPVPSVAMSAPLSKGPAKSTTPARHYYDAKARPVAMESQRR